MTIIASWWPCPCGGGCLIDFIAETKEHIIEAALAWAADDHEGRGGDLIQLQRLDRACTQLLLTDLEHVRAATQRGTRLPV